MTALLAWLASTGLRDHARTAAGYGLCVVVVLLWNVALYGWGRADGIGRERVRQAQALADAREAAQTAQRKADQIGVESAQRWARHAADQQEKADETVSALRTELARTPRCVVSRAAGGLLDRAAGVPASARSAAPSGRAAAGTGITRRHSPAPDAREWEYTDATVIESCARNYTLARRNADQLGELQRWYHELQRSYNHAD